MDKSKSITVNVAVRNDSTRAFWVEFEWKGPGVPVGVLSPGISATTVGIPWPYAPSASLLITDQQTKEKHNVHVSFLQINSEIRSGRCHEVTVRIKSAEEADAICE